MDTRDAPILVMGAGLQGTGIALELARRGVGTTLVDQDPVPVNRASLRNEGKIHLGLIYANDPSQRTASLMLEGALSFRSIVSRWVGDDQWLARSTPFHYLVAADTAVPVDRLAEHYGAVERDYHQRIDAAPTADYLGERPRWLARRLTEEEIAARFEPSHFAGGFATNELAVDTEMLSNALRQRVAQEPRVTFLCSRTVRHIERAGEAFVVEGDGAEGAWRIRAQQVVNATWERRLALDRQLGLKPPQDLLHRLKYRTIVRLPESLRGGPSVSMVLGRYGDVVIRSDGTAYLSWYPVGLRGWTNDTEPPDDWNAACRGEPDAEEAALCASESIAAIDAWYPGIAQAEPLLVDAGAIVAIGRSDVDDTKSALHDRTRVGITSLGGYHTVDGGKLTTVPRFALEAADAVESVAKAGRIATPSAAIPRVVALVPTYRAADYISKTIDALAAQTYGNLEILISDDASPDDTAAICESRAEGDARLRVIRQPKNLSWVGNVNALLAEARGDLFLFAFQDDLPEPDYIERCVAALEANPRTVLAFSDVSLVHQNGSREVKVYATLDGVRDAAERGRLVADQISSWWIPNRGVFRSSAARTIGGLRKHRAGEFSADWPWLLHLALLGEFVRVPEVLVTKTYMTRSLSRSWHFGVREWLAVTQSAMDTVASAKLPLDARLSIQATLIRFAAGHVWRACRKALGRWTRRVGLRGPRSGEAA